MYLLRKWYADLLTQEGMYLFLYYAFMRVAGVTARSLVLHIAPAGSDNVTTIPLEADCHTEEGREGRGVRVRLKNGGIMIGENECRISVESSSTAVNLVYAPVITRASGPVVIAGPNGGRILWEPVGLRYRVWGTVAMNGSRLEVRDCQGYADFLESTILPFRVPVRKLIWGRGHFPNGDLAFMHASGEYGTPSWSRLILQREGRVEESNMVGISDVSRVPNGAPASAPGSYLVRAALPHEEFAMTVSHRKTVQQGSFIDQQRYRQPARSFIKRVTRDPRGSKYLSSAEIPAWGSSATGLSMIDEEAYL